jgi:hypothetical protein
MQIARCRTHEEPNTTLNQQNAGPEPAMFERMPNRSLRVQCAASCKKQNKNKATTCELFHIFTIKNVSQVNDSLGAT